MEIQRKVYVVDDDAEVRASLARLMKEISLPVEAASTANEFLETYDPNCVSCLVVDVRMPGASGIDLQRKLLEDGIAIPVIVISGHGDIPLAVEAMKLGALDFLEKPFRAQSLLDRVQQALAMDERQREERAERASVAGSWGLLTQREQEVVDLVVEGLTNKEIAARLGVSPQAIDAHRGKAFTKLGVHSVAGLVKVALTVGAQ